MEKASVLPVPVRACPIRSVPVRAIGRVISWMGKASVMPTASRASTISGSTPSSLNVDRTNLDSSSRPGGRRQGAVSTPVYRSKRSRLASLARMSENAAPHDLPAAFSDPGYRDAVVDLLGGLAYSELSAFERMVEDAKMAPSLADKVALASMANVEFSHFDKLRVRLLELGADPFAAMEPFHDPVDAFHEHTAPSSWLESLIKAYVGDGLAADFYREIAAYVDADTRELILSTLADTGHSEFAVDRVRQAI